MQCFQRGDAAILEASDHFGVPAPLIFQDYQVPAGPHSFPGILCSQVRAQQYGGNVGIRTTRVTPFINYYNPKIFPSRFSHFVPLF